MSDVRVKRGAELSTDHHLVVCTLKALKPLRKRKTFRPQKTYRIQWESLADKEVRTAFADSIAYKFKELPTSTENIETEWCLFQTAVITSATNCCESKRVGGTKSSKKRTPWWNQEVKEAICAKKVAYKAWLANKSSLELCLQYEARKALKLNSEAHNAAATKVKLSKERAWKEVRESLDDNFKMANKVFWQTIRHLRRKISQTAFFIKSSNSVTLKDQDAVLNCWIGKYVILFR